MPAVGDMDEAQIRTILGPERVDRFHGALGDLVRAVTLSPAGVGAAAALRHFLIGCLSSALTITDNLSESGQPLAPSPSPNALDLQIGARITLRREKLGLSQVGLARRIGVGSGLLRAGEAGAARVDVARV